MWQIVRDLVADGVTIFLTTQYLEEADQLADRIAVLDGGRLVAEGTPAELKRGATGGHVRLQFADAERRKAAAEALGIDDLDQDELRVPSNGGVHALRSLLEKLDRAGIEVEDLSVHRPDLDDVFLARTGAGR
jgi:ABC-2 type transport system ATP-binding protein